MKIGTGTAPRKDARPEEEYKKGKQIVDAFGTWGHDSCENVKVWLLQQEQRARARLRSCCSARVGRAIEACRSIAWEQGCVRGTRHGLGALGAQALSLLQLLYADERAAPSCKCESRRGKAHRFPQPAANKHELPSVISRVCWYLSLPLSLCLALHGRGVAGHGKFRHPLLRNPTRHAAGSGSGARLAAGECWREYCSLEAELNGGYKINRGRNVVRACVTEVMVMVMSAASCV